MPPFDFLSKLRMQSILGGGMPQAPPFNPMMNQESPTFQNPFQNPTMPLPQPMGDSDVGNRMQELYTPETQASDRFNQMIGQFPQREKPGKLKMLAELLYGGIAGPKEAVPMIDNPFQQKVEDWKNQIAPMQQAASLERQTNVNERTLAYQTVSQELRAKADEARAKNDERKAEIQEHRAAIYEFKARNPNARFDFRGPTVLVADPVSGKVTNSGVPTGSMSKMDELALRQEQALERIEASGAESRQTKQTQAAPSPNMGATAQLPTQQIKAKQLRANQAVQENPAWASYISINPTTGMVDIKPPATGRFQFGRPDQPTYDAIIAYMGGQTTKPKTEPKPPITTGGRGATPPKQTTPKTGKVRVEASDGTTGTWDLSKGPIPKGFTRIE